MDSIPNETLETLSQCFLHTLSPLRGAPPARPNPPSAEAGRRRSLLVALSRLLSAPPPSLRSPSPAINLKNLLRSRYLSLPDAERAQLKTLIPSILLSSPPRIQPQLSETLAIISSHDFPNSWPSLLPDLVAALRSAADYSAINSVLAAFNSIFSKFRHSYDTQALRLGFAAPLLEVFMKTSALIAGGNHSAPLFESQRLCCEIFYSMNSIELPEFFEDHMKEWMGEFLVYLTTTYSGNVEAEGVVDSLRAAICNNLQLYMEKNEEEFRPYLGGFASAVYNLLTTAAPSASPARYELTITAIKFLTTVSTSVHHSLFGSADILQQICGSIVFPNLRLRDEDEELFDMNYIEYIRRDIEGSDIDTRRRIVCELLRGLATNYKDQVTNLVSSQIQNMLAVYAANPSENWKEKDCAIYLVVSLGAKAAAGGVQLVDVDSFFLNVIVPELQGPDVNAYPMLKAGALKFLTVFREQIPKQAAVSLLPNVIGLLRAESNVVHSYAANCLEKLLLVKDKVQSGPNVVVVQARYSSADIDPYVLMLITNLAGALKFPESQENPYVMKCIMRILKVASISEEAANFCIDGLTSILVEVCKNPKSPLFNHYLFEAIAALVGRSCEKNPMLIILFEAKLFPVLQNILVNDISEFWPYAFQIFAQLVDMSQPPLSENYMQLFQTLLTPASWERSANVPALVRLLQAYLQKIPNELSSGGRLGQVLGIFHNLVMAPKTEDLGFYVLNTVVENLGHDMIAPYLNDIWKALFTRLQGKHNVKFVNCLVILMSLVLVKHGPTVLVSSINAVQSNIFTAIVDKFWIPALKLISGQIEVKLTSVASTRLICESPALLDPAAVELWGKMLNGIITLLAQPEKNGIDLEADVQEIPESTGYSASFARLQSAGKKEEDPLKEIKDPKGFLVTSLARLSSASPGRYPAVIEQYVDPSNRAVLLQLCGTYNCTIV
ncbi:LOW QUALITY PROTEIN: exportin-2 [Asparagus officinalis]|uniref:LOW QUALITY PROTEIN: exportin-2 n=1 Tax=Asparagus officinalis TaxID=4686 RepID=UPI00098E58EA|nr:LOW QUALITY PROTEIN: exportin-2 [Asparagus officinalis]